MELTLVATIRDFKPENTAEFKALNLAWMQQFDSQGGGYVALLSNPEENILAKGGKIFIAFVDDVLVGTCALVRLSVKQFELCLMAVKPNYQGKNIGKQLLSSALDYAREVQVKSIELITNPKLTAAIELYETHGFHEVKNYEPQSILFDANDIKMVISLM